MLSRKAFPHTAWAERQWSDLRYGLRCLRRSPAFAALTILTIALGIGASTAIFSIVYSEILRPVPYQDPSHLIRLAEGRGDSVGAADFLAWRTQARSFVGMAAVTRPEPTILTGGGSPDQAMVARASADFFQILGNHAIIGEVFRPNDLQGIVVSNDYWRRHFGGNPGILGEVVELNGKPFTIVGVMPRDFDFEGSDLWEPLTFSSVEMTDNKGPFLRVIARLKPGITLPEARAEMRVLGGRAPLSRQEQGNISVTLLGRPDSKNSGYLFALLAAVSFTFLIACSNVASMFLARGASRYRELAIRTALGAERSRLVGPLVAEGIIVAGTGGFIGLILAGSVLRVINSFTPNGPIAGNITGAPIGLSVIAFAFGLSLLTVLFVGRIPAWMVWRTDLTQALNDSCSELGMSVRKSHARNILVVLEIALSLVLLIGACLMLETLHSLSKAPTGLNTRAVLTIRLPLVGYHYNGSAQIVAFYDEVVRRVQTLPGVKYASITNNFPLSDASVSLAMYAPGVSQGKVVVDLKDVTPDYFLAMGIPLLRGRSFSSSDNSSSQQVVIINQTMARRYWPGRDPIGETIMKRWVIVGLVGDTIQSSLRVVPVAAVYRPFAQQPFAPNIATLIVRAAASPKALESALRRTIWAIEPDQPLVQIRTMDEVIADSVWQPRLSASTLSFVALLGLFISTVGLYGVISYSVTMRRHEMGIRMALGAKQGHVLRLFLVQGLFLTACGVLLGSTAAVGLTRFLRTFLFGVGPFDPRIFCACAATFVSVGLLACYIPARRAISVDPVISLRRN